MLRTRDLLRSNGLNLLPCQEVLLHDSALPFDIPEFAQQSYDSTKASNKSSGISTDLQMAVTEISSGLSRQVIRFPDVLTNSSRGPSLVHSTEYLINYDEGSGLHRIYTLATGEFMGQVKKLSGLNQKISRAVASKLNAGMFFFVSEDNSMHTVLIQPKSKAPIKISPMYKLDKAIPANVDRPKGKVESLLSHPTLPLLFVLYNDGSTYVRINNALLSF